MVTSLVVGAIPVMFARMAPGMPTIPPVVIAVRIGNGDIADAERKARGLRRGRHRANETGGADGAGDQRHFQRVLHCSSPKGKRCFKGPTAWCLHKHEASKNMNRS